MGGCVAKELVDFDGPIDFRQFEILRAIGKGAFGKVCIVKKKDTKEMYAMKYMNKVQIIEKRAVDNVFREIHILKALDHPFIVNLWFSFQDEEDIFLVLDLMLGGDISYHLEKESRFSVPRVRLYLAEICLALEYLAEQKIIHRDIKPANMLLDSKGHVHLTDFNVACICRQGKNITSMTGTKPYMAPEVIRPSRGGYSYAVDWWSLGVSAYEMLRGERPYTIHHNMSTDEIHRILTRVRPPASARWDDSTCNVLKLLLHPDAAMRLASLDEAKTHSFFKEMDWEKVLHSETAPSYIPSQNRIHCDPTHELEEMIVEPNPLHKKKARLSSRRRNNEVGGVQEELDKINKKFSVYNRLRDSVLRVESHEEDHTATNNSPLNSLSVNTSGTNLSLVKESATAVDNHAHHVKTGEDRTTKEEEGSTVTSPIQITVQVFENEEEEKKKKSNSEEEETQGDWIAKGHSLEKSGEEEKRVESTSDKGSVEQNVEGKENQTSEKDTGEEVQSVTSVPDPEGVSSGTPSNIYNPKDSDSLVPLGSFHGSLEGVTAGLLAENGETVEEDSTDKEMEVIVSPSSIGEGSKSEEVEPSVNGTTAKDNHSNKNSLTSTNSVVDDSDSRRLIR